jgi:hypothetical protein
MSFSTSQPHGGPATAGKAVAGGPAQPFSRRLFPQDTDRRAFAGRPTIPAETAKAAPRVKMKPEKTKTNIS